MEKKKPLKGLIIRTAVSRSATGGFIFAEDPKNETPHTLIFKYVNSEFVETRANFSAHSSTLISNPEPGLIMIGGSGTYSSVLASGTKSADLFDQALPAPSRPRITGIRSVSTVDGKAYAVGLRGMAYRFDKTSQWTRVDEGLPETFDAQACHGLCESELYVVGRDGAMFVFNGKNWSQCNSPTTATLTTVKCTPNGDVYVAGHGGVILKGNKSKWELLPQPQIDENIWDLEWFKGHLYASTMTNVFQLQGKDLKPIDFGSDSPKSCYQLSACDDVMWSNGEFDVMSFDGNSWSRIV